MTMRIIGESPQGNVAYATVEPSHAGPCCMRYRLQGDTFVVRFKDYAAARTAATRAIFSFDPSFSDVRVLAGNQELPSLPYYANASSWFTAQEQLTV